MADSARQRKMYTVEAESYYSSLACACAIQGNEYGYSYYWWYYAIPTNSCHALEK